MIIENENVRILALVVITLSLSLSLRSFLFIFNDSQNGLTSLKLSLEHALPSLIKAYKAATKEGGAPSPLEKTVH